MSIIGLGFDATDIPRVREVFERYGDRFLHRGQPAGAAGVDFEAEFAAREDNRLLAEAEGSVWLQRFEDHPVERAVEQGVGGAGRGGRRSFRRTNEGED